MIRSLSFDERDPTSGKNKLLRVSFSFNETRFSRRFRTRRKREDCDEIIPEQKWFRLLDLALLRQSSYFDDKKQESVGSRWSRAKMRAAKVGKGLSKDVNARKLAPEHWREAVSSIYNHFLLLFVPYSIKMHNVSPNRSTHGIDTDIISIFTTTSGVSAKATSRSFTGACA